MVVKRKRKGRGKFIAGCICGLAVIAFVGSLNLGGFGFGDGWGFGGSGSGSGSGGSGSGGSGYDANGNGDGDNGGSGESADDASGDAAALIQLIVVEGDLILHNGEEISLEQLGGLLENYSDAIWELRSERAIAAVYDDVRALLLEHNVTFTETTG